MAGEVRPGWENTRWERKVFAGSSLPGRGTKKKKSHLLVVRWLSYGFTIAPADFRWLCRMRTSNPRALLLFGKLPVPEVCRRDRSKLSLLSRAGQGLFCARRAFGYEEVTSPMDVIFEGRCSVPELVRAAVGTVVGPGDAEAGGAPGSGLGRRTCRMQPQHRRRLVSSHKKLFQSAVFTAVQAR